MAQANFKPGLVVTLEGDTLRGFINYKEWANTPSTITFREAANSGTERAYTPADARYIEITGMEALQRYEGPISMNPVAIDRISHEAKMQLEPVVVFLKVNYKGTYANLLSYTDKLKTRFFYQEHDGSQPQELYFNRHYASSNSSVIIIQKGYAGQIQHLANKYDVINSRLNRDIEAAQYIEHELESLFSKLNESRVSSPAPKGIKSSAARFYTGLALSSSAVRLSGFRELDDPDSNPASYMPLVAFGTDIFLNRHIQKFYFRVEGALTTAKYHVQKEAESEREYHHYSYKISHQNFAVSPQFIYSLYNTDNFKFHVGVIGKFNISNYYRNVYREEEKSSYQYTTNPVHTINHYQGLDLMRFWFGYAFRAGVVLNQKYEAYATYMPYTAVTQYNNRAIEFKSLNIGMNYLFKSR